MFNPSVHNSGYREGTGIARSLHLADGTIERQAATG